MRLESDEWLKVTPIVDNGVELLDMRIWRKTPTGGIPTRKSLIIPDKMLVPLIMGLQKIHRQESERKAKQATGVTQG